MAGKSKTKAKRDIKAILSQIEQGKTLTQIATKEGITKQSLHGWLLHTDEKAYRDSQRIVADSIAAEMLDIADHEPDVARARNQLNARQFILSHRFPRIYGDRVQAEVTGANGAPLMQPIINLAMSAPVETLTVDADDAEVVE